MITNRTPKNSGPKEHTTSDGSPTSNQATLSAYAKGIKRYLKNTPKVVNDDYAPMREWIDAALAFVPSGGKVLEFGTGGGRDARYMKSAGHLVQCSDAVSGFVNYLRDNGEDALLLNLLSDDIPSGYSMMFANSVLPHFTKQEVALVLQKTFDALLPNGVFAFSIKRGDGEIWIHEKGLQERFVQLWQPEDIADTTKNVGYKIVYMKEGIVGHLPNHDWIVIIAQKVS